MQTYVAGVHVFAKCRIHKIINLLMSLCRQISRRRILLEAKLRPHDNVHNARIYAIWPVVAQDLYVVCRSSGHVRLNQRLGRRRGCGTMANAPLY